MSKNPGPLFAQPGSRLVPLSRQTAWPASVFLHPAHGCAHTPGRWSDDLEIGFAFFATLYVKDEHPEGGHPEDGLHNHCLVHRFKLLSLFAEVLHHGEEVLEYLQQRGSGRDDHH